MFGWELPPYNSGGLGTACEGLSRALVAQNINLIFVLPKTIPLAHPPFRVLFAGLEGIAVRRLEGFLYPYVTEKEYKSARPDGHRGDLYGLNLLEEVRLYAWRARELASNEDFDIIHAHDWLSFPAGIVAREVSGKPLVVHVHATEFDRTGGHSTNQAVYEIEKEGMEKADAIITVSEWTKNMVIRHYGIRPEKITVVHNGIDSDNYRRLSARLTELKQAGYKVVLFVGRVTLQKGPDYFVTLAERVLKHCPKTYFILAGSGDMLGAVVEAAAGLGLSHRFIFPGFLRGEELDALYQAADLYVLPSVSEPFGITPLEALANGTPVLVSKQSGVSEVLRHALKADFWDVEEMTNQIVSVLKHGSLRQALVEHGQKEAGGVTWRAAARKCAELYAKMI